MPTDSPSNFLKTVNFAKKLNSTFICWVLDSIKKKKKVKLFNDMYVFFAFPIQTFRHYIFNVIMGHLFSFKTF